ncbi:hypothetical protein Tco_1544500, partial [Tanacetum coccineum]
MSTLTFPDTHNMVAFLEKPAEILGNSKEDADGTDCLPTATIFKELARMGDSTADVPNEEHVPTHSNDLLLSGEDRMKLNELMDICTKLSERVLDLEHTKTAQAQEITNLKLRVKKLDKKAGFRTHNFKRLYKLETEEPVINAATTTKVQNLRKKDVVQESSENVSTATTMVSTATTTVVATPPQQRAIGIAFREPVESTVTTTVPSQK